MRGARALSGAIVALGVLAGSAGAFAASRIEVPIRQTTLSDGTPRYSVPVRIGDGGTVDAMLDTGSTGLRLLPGAASRSRDIVDSDARSEMAYGSGVRILGIVGHAPVRIGDAPTNRAIAIQVVRTVDCLPRRPDCPASRIGMDEYGFGGDGRPGEGFSAIIGVSVGPETRRDGVINPLYSVGDGRWIIELPRPGTDETGLLIVNPTAEELAGYLLFDLPAGGRETISGCLSNDRTDRRFCGPTLLDSGAPGVRVTTERVRRHIRWRYGTLGTLSFRQTGDAFVSMRFHADPESPARRVVLMPPHGERAAGIHAGVVPYFAFSVLYDGRGRKIGLKRRP